MGIHVTPAPGVGSALVHDVTDPAFGAKGNGTDEDTAAIVAAIAAAKATRGIVYFPPGTYITQPLQIPGGVHLMGVTGTKWGTHALASELKLKAGSTSPLISPDDSPTKACEVHLSGLYLNNNSVAQSCISLPDQGAYVGRIWHIEDCSVIGTTGASSRGIYIGNQNTACVIERCTVSKTGTREGNGIHVYGSDSTVLDCWVTGWDVGIYADGGDSDEYLQVRGGGTFTNTMGVAVGGMGAMFSHVSIDHNYNDGAFVVKDCVFFGCWFHTNSRQTANTWANIHQQGTPKIGLFGCRATPHAGETAYDPAYMIYSTGGGVNIVDQGTQVAAGVTWGTGYKNY